MTSMMNRKKVAPTVAPRYLTMPKIPETLRNKAIPLKLPKGAEISYNNTSVYYVETGTINAYAVDSESGKQYLSYVLGPQSLFMESGFIEGVCPEKMTLEALFRANEDCDLLRISKDPFIHLFDTNIEVSKYVSSCLARKMHAFSFFYYETICHDATWRVASLLYSLSLTYGNQQGSLIVVEYPLSQQSIAETLGINRVTVAKSMKHLKAQKLVSKIDENYCIVDWRKFGNYLISLRSS